MKRAARRRHLLFFSTSLAAHLLFVVAALVAALVVSDIPRINPDRPRGVSLEKGVEGTGAPAPKASREEIAAVRSQSAPSDAAPTKAPGDPERTDGVIGEGVPGGISGIPTDKGQGDPRVLSDYIRSVRARINRHKSYPPKAAKDGIEGTVTVSFLLDRRGALLAKEIVAGSGHPVLDEAALAAIRDSSPFPPFPEGLSRETLLLKLPINYRRR